MTESFRRPSAGPSGEGSSHPYDSADHSFSSAQRSQSVDSWRAWVIPASIVGLGFAELALLITLAFRTQWWVPLILIVVGWVVAFALTVAAGHQSFVRVRALFRALKGRGDMASHVSRPVFTLLAALLFAFPGVISDVVGIILLIVPVQKAAAKKTGLSGSTGATRRLVFGRSGGIIQGEIIVEAEKTQPPTNDTPHSGRPIEG